jgi:hypothetical protein
MMIASSATTVVGIFDNQEQAAAGIRALKQAGFTDAQIGVSSRHWSHEGEGVRLDEQHVAEQGAVAGAVVGGTLGAVLGLAGAVLLPGAAPILAGHALLSALGGGLAGAGGGTFVGPFIAMGYSEAEAKAHARHLEQGKTLVLVHAPDRMEAARSILVEHGAYDESMSTSP